MKRYLSLLLGFSMGCVIGTKGENGLLMFYDQTKTPEFMDTNRELETPVAVGAKLSILIKTASTLTPVEIEDVKSDPPILEVLKTDHAVVTVKAMAPGQPRLTVTAGGLSDTITVDVVNPYTQVIEPRPWYNFYMNPTAFEKGLSVLKGSKIWLFGWQNDAQGNHLTGYGTLKWKVDGEAFDSAPEPDSDYLELTAVSDGKSDITFGQAHYELFAAQEKDITTLKFYEALHDEKVADSFTTSPGTPLVIYLAFYDKDGRLITGEVQGKPEIHASAQGVIKLGQLCDQKETDPKKINYPCRFLLLSCEQESGSSTVQVNWAGQEGRFTATCIKKVEKDEN